ncbi:MULTISPECIES: 2-C-methyl-D-erythritol 4-phosphate cytidylyltransferase [Acidobacterium]|uniref:2-C-methyl-D-erythritol 4-phosphate cytidylyltransferase n=1 Tax=Acidobacterium capsulatum (strain ATCC 51196 / DSM 11244 / BCRC 80197 / JCM 7670 / NBRC 15755 / NCIMB 13165 / 161) TaxID=240015 RepID=ISPD_ACIC5|nr:MULTISPECIES: 2-C-methyl-D-erythritol 4-phosphate cytidylyltransferase [Acidobacterium]C1F763.1 RecName: Full=2-C-methyl-D-erythritol 4-phosphate cytidylyltransferase; AltName: Full=4-diphosphocytidyl-2C-methyl-D-erythritol synthase; AltName: Full=MEP cytidylyltransferase; Short=MCT [Acidobacterium capsulatum ATCC 51196]ACO33402.1 2-C-methyl-D-erythritol 4-phosphate cytidylyltransferase [Acidobacterium capsulatum ATCC 51196]HCT60998.1 2-C-methyl-D-erythritol 4-phosphate cytidylyltransferase [
MRVFVILPAAGLGTRMAAGSHTPHQPKQFLELEGVPVLIHTLRAFAAVPAVSAMIVAVRPNEIERVQAQVNEYGFQDKVRVVAGGDSRQQSVSRALATVECDASDIVLVHDAVRPLIEPAVIARTIEAVEKSGAAIVGLPAVDTIKQVERTAAGAIITATIPREYIVQAQTPQGFRCELLRRAFAEAEADGFTGTDEASLVERAGAQVTVVPGSPSNMKITQPGDLELAAFYLRQRSSR